MTEKHKDIVLLQDNKKINMCRICLQEHSSLEDGVNLFVENEMSKDNIIVNNIYMCTQVLFKSNEYFPNKVCNTCVRELEIANAFRLKCLISEESLKRYSIFLERSSSDENNTVIDNILTEEPCQIKDDIELSSNSSDKEDLPLQASDFRASTESLIYSVQNVANQYKCNICDKILKTNVSLINHKIAMHQKRKNVGKVTGHGATRMYHCVKCPYSTRHGQSLVYHMRTHTGEKPFVCDCGKQFTQPSSLAAHRKTHSEHTFYTCPECGKQFKYKTSFKNHQRVHEKASFACNICIKVLKSNQSLKAHLQRHYNVRNYNCDLCGATFVTCAELLNHKKKHGYEKKFQCHLCDYKTHLKKILIVHIKRHSGERAHACSICEFSCYTAGDLVRHIRTHTREKLYTCPTCDQKFMHSSSVNKHMLNVHHTRYLWNDVVDRTTVKSLSNSTK